MYKRQAGIATTGKVPFASTFAMFAAGRAFEQVRNSVGYPKLNVKIGATHGGISVGEDGATPVSYTHLDVYKRQVLRCALQFRDIHSEVGHHVHMIVCFPQESEQEQQRLFWTENMAS